MTNIFMADRIFRLDQVQEILNFGKDKIYSLIDAGELIAHCDNGVMKKPLRIVGTSVAEYIARHSVSTEDWKRKRNQ